MLSPLDTLGQPRQVGMSERKSQTLIEADRGSVVREDVEHNVGDAQPEQLNGQRGGDGSGIATPARGRMSEDIAEHRQTVWSGYDMCPASRDEALTLTDAIEHAMLQQVRPKVSCGV